MGSQVTARCECGLESDILIGGGMFSFETTCYFPCLCEQCHAVVQVNLLDKQLQCPQCEGAKVVPYDDPTLLEHAGSRSVGSWNVKEQLGRELKLTDGRYRCPRCGRMTLQFAEGGLMWD
jgi:Zn finger protein HypA/HybF involved in hydrogenase expression